MSVPILRSAFGEPMLNSVLQSSRSKDGFYLPIHNAHPQSSYSRRKRVATFLETLSYILGFLALIYLLRTSHPLSPTIHLIVAGSNSQSVSFATSLALPSIVPLRFTPDIIAASAKGREAMVFLSYIFDFYESLPDICIFVHGYGDDALEYNPFEGLKGAIAEMLEKLDLDAVLENGFVPFDFRPTLEATHYEQDPIVLGTFLGHFPEVPRFEPPPVLNSSTSMFALSSSRIRSIPRQRYKQHLDLLKVSYPVNPTALTAWDQFWSFRFTGSGMAPMPSKNLCKNWGLCFVSQFEFERWLTARKELEKEKHRADIKGEIRAKEVMVEQMRIQAWERGKDNVYRKAATVEMFQEGSVDLLRDVH